MKRALQVAAIWDRLPAFRAIAETEHLPSAAKRVGVSAPALSRSLKQLEEQLGTPLFQRVGRRLELAPSGQMLLSAVRDAMRLVHDSLEEIAGQSTSGAVWIAASDAAMPVVLLGTAALLDDYGSLVPNLVPVPASGVRAGLLSGALDVAVVDAPHDDPDLDHGHLWDEPTRVFCGPTHELATAGVFADGHGFCAPAPADDGTPRDGWPAATPRVVRAEVATTGARAGLCRQGTLLAVLPECVGRERGLVSLEHAPVTHHTSVFWVRRRKLVDHRDRVDVVVERVRAVVSSHAT